MSGYIPSENVKFEWDGDVISCEIEPITNADFSKLLPFYSRGDDGDMVLGFEDQMDFARIAGEMLPNYIKNFEGLTDAKGGEVGLEVVLDKVYFMDLKSELMQRLFDLSVISKEDEKKSGEPSGPGSPVLTLGAS